jgi:hypothetical protein
VVTTRRAWCASIVALVVAATAVTSADDNQKAFEKQWTGRRVLVKRPLYSLVYNEHGPRGGVHQERDGLTVVTPFEGTYFQFDGRHKIDDVLEHDVEKIAPSVTVAYRKDRLLEGWLQVIEPVLLTRYDQGVELTVSAARVERDTVRLSLVRGGDQELATTLTVKWPLHISKSFTERGNVEALIQQYLTARE